METKVDDAYEQISYKIEMSIKNKQSLVESDADNMDVFKRIDRVRRLSKVLRTSAFCEIMDGCAKVTSPIQRTNLMMKDPDYRTCYKLWQLVVASSLTFGKAVRLASNPLIFIPIIIIPLAILLFTNLFKTVKYAKKIAKEEEEAAVREIVEELNRRKKEDTKK